MATGRASALVIFGITGDLAKKLVLPALYRLEERKVLDEPIIGVARSQWDDSERWDFTPSKLRKIGGFDAKEYANHCEAGGHPHPAGRKLLETTRKMNQLERAASDVTNDFDMTRALWLDFAFHCDRTWRALEDLLSTEHARFDLVRGKAIATVAQARAEWEEADFLALNAGSVLGAIYADPMGQWKSASTCS